MIMVLLTIEGWAQLTVVSGTVVDAETRDPIAGASVTMGSVAVVTNDDGFFTLKNNEWGEVVVSHLGYGSQRIVVDSQPNKPLTIALKVAPIRLQEVLVMAGDARELVLSAIGRISVNYPRKAEFYHCYFKDYIMCLNRMEENTI